MAEAWVTREGDESATIGISMLNILVAENEVSNEGKNEDADSRYENLGAAIEESFIFSHDHLFIFE